MCLVLIFKPTGNGQKVAKTKIVWKNAYVRLSEAKG